MPDERRPARPSDVFGVPGVTYPIEKKPTKRAVPWLGPIKPRRPEAAIAYERGEPMDWWTYDPSRGETGGILPSPTPEIPQFALPKGPGPFAPASQTDFEIWAIEEMKEGLNNWWEETGAKWQDTVQATSAPRTGLHRLTDPILHSAIGVINAGLLQGIGPIFGAPNYLVERTLGRIRRSGPLPLSEEEEEKWKTEARYPGGVGRPSVDDWLRTTYGDDPDLQNRAELAAREADRITYSWWDRPIEDFKRIHTRIMDAKDSAEVEKILKQEQRLIPEILFGLVLDPVNIVTWMGKAPLATRQARKVANLAASPIDETLDVGTALARSTGWFRTPVTKARKAGELTYDRVRFLLTQAKNKEDIPRVLRSFLKDPIYDSTHGQLTKRTLEAMKDEQIYNGVDKAEALVDAIQRVSKNIGDFASGKERQLYDGTIVGNALDDLARFNRVQKKIYSPLFLGWSGQYPVGNWWDNMRNLVTRIGFRRIPGGTIKDYLGFSTKAAESFFADEVGAIPKRLMYGFSVTPAEIPVEGAEQAASVWRKILSFFAPTPGPGLRIGAATERNFSALAITQSYLKRWPQNWKVGRGIPDLPGELADNLRAINPDLLDAIQSVPLGKYNFQQVLDELANIEDVIVRGATVEGRLYSTGWYLQQLTKLEREALQAHPDLLEQIRKLGGVTDEFSRREVLGGLRRIVTEGVDEVSRVKHLDDLQAVGWGHQNAEMLRATEAITRRWGSNPLVMEMLDKGAHDFDLFRRIANVYGVSPLDLCSPMTEVEFDILRRGGTPLELMEHYKQTYPFLAKYDRWIDDLLELAAEDGVIEATEQLTHFDEITGPRARDAFFDIYKWLKPQARRAIVRDIPEIDLIRKTPGIGETLIQKNIRAMQEWIEKNPGAKATSDEYDEVQRVMQLLKQYMWYKTNPDTWSEWANSTHKVDRLPDDIPNLYDVYKQYSKPLTSAIEKLDYRTVRDLSPDMEVPAALWQRITSWFDAEVQKAQEITAYTTARLALLDRDYALLDYGDKTIFDALFTIGVPFEYWQVHSTWNWGQYMLDHPNVLSWLHRSQKTIEAQIEKDELIPNRLKGWIPIGLQAFKNFVTDKAWSAETEHYIRPERLALPLELMPIWGETFMPDSYQEIPRGREWILFNNMWSTNPLLFDGGAMAANAILPWAEKHQPTLAEYIKRYVPPTALQVGASYWSGTRGVRGGSIVLEGLLNKMGIRVPPEGLNPEGTLHEWLGMARVSPSETYWRYQWLANLAGTGEITTEEAIQSFREQDGKAWGLASRMAAEQTAVPSFVRWSTYMPIKQYPAEERVMRGMGLIYQDAYERYKAGDRDALREFYAVYPDYRFRQLAYRYWDTASGKMTEDDWQDWINTNLTVNEYYQKRGDLERERMKALQLFPAGSPEHYRTRQHFSDLRQGLYEDYGDVLDTYFDSLADNRRQYLQWRDSPKAQAMRGFLDKWYAADPKQKQKMLENLPQTIEEVAREARALEEPRLFTAQEVRQELCRRDMPVDAVYRELNNQSAKAWDLYYTDWTQKFDVTPPVQDLYAAYLELDFPDNVNFRDAHPELDMALTAFEEWRDDILDTTLDPTTPEFLANIRVLHPDWNEDAFAEVNRIGNEIGSFTVSDYTFIRGSDRDMVINELWRFWTALPAKTLGRKRAKEVLGPRFSEQFLAGEYGQISDEELALWLNLLPSDWQSLVPEGRRPPFGEGPLPISEEMYKMYAQKLSQEEWDALIDTWIPPEPETRETHLFGPTARVEDMVTEEQARKESQVALEDARAKLLGRGAIPKPETFDTPEEFQNYIFKRYFSDDAQKVLAGVTVIVEDLTVEGGGGGSWPITKENSYARIMVYGIQDEGAVHELAHMWSYGMDLFDADATNDVVAIDPTFRPAIKRLADEEDLQYARAAELAHKYEYGEGDWPGMGENDAERFAGLASGIMGDLTQLPPYVRKFYEGMFPSPAELIKGEPIDKIELPSPAEELEYQTAYQLMQRAYAGETDFWNDPLVKKWFPPNSPSRRFWQFWYDAIPPGKLGQWAKDNSLVSAILDKVSRGYIIEDAYRDALAFLIEDVPMHDIGDPREYKQARAEAEEYYGLATPEQEQLRDIYFTLPKGNARRQFIKEQPLLQALFNAQNEFKATHPIYTKYYDPGWVERTSGDAGAGGYSSCAGYYGGVAKGTFTSGVSWQSFVASAGPLVMGELMEYWAGRSTLSSNARVHLKKMWQKSGTEDEFSDWLDSMKRLWIYFGTQGFKAPKAPRVYLPGGGTQPGLRATGRARWMVRR